MSDFSGRNTSVLQYEMSALKRDDDEKHSVYALSNSTETAALTVFSEACPMAMRFAFSALSEFQAALSCSAASKAANLRSESTSDLVFSRITVLGSEMANWVAIYADAGCIRVFGRGRFLCYFIESTGRFVWHGGCESGVAYDAEARLEDDKPLWLLVVSASQHHDKERVRFLCEATKTIKCTADSLAYAYVNYMVAENGFCVFALSAKRFRTSSQTQPRKPGSPKKTELRFLDSSTDQIRLTRRCISRSCDAIEVETN